MKFSDAANSAGLVEDVDFICGTDSVSYPTADKARNMNRHYYKAVIDVLKAEGRMQFDDSANLNSIPEYTFDLVAGQKQYALPTNLLKLWALEIKDINGDFYRLRETDIDDETMARSITDRFTESGIPMEYDIRGENVFIGPAPASGQVTLTAGGKMHFSREIDLFTAADTTQEPGFAEPFHRIVSLGAAYDWLVLNDTQQKADRVLSQYEQLRAELREFYSTRNKDSKIRLRPAHRQHDYL